MAARTGLLQRCDQLSQMQLAATAQAQGWGSATVHFRLQHEAHTEAAEGFRKLATDLQSLRQELRRGHSPADHAVQKA